MIGHVRAIVRGCIGERDPALLQELEGCAVDAGTDSLDPLELGGCFHKSACSDVERDVHVNGFADGIVIVRRVNEFSFREILLEVVEEVTDSFAEDDFHGWRICVTVRTSSRQWDEGYLWLEF